MASWELPLTQAASRFVEEIRINVDAFLAFYDFARSQQVIENVHFVFAVEEYVSLPCSERRSREEELMAAFIREESSEKINITDAILQQLVPHIGLGRARVFDAAAAHCVEMLALGPWADFKEDYAAPSSPAYTRGTPSSAQKVAQMLRAKVASPYYPCVLWAFNRSRTHPFMAPPLNAGQMQKWLFSSPLVARLLAHSFVLDADIVAIRATLGLLPFIKESLIHSFFDFVLHCELFPPGSESSLHKEAPKEAKLAVSLSVFEEYFLLVGIGWLRDMLEPFLGKIYSATPEAFAEDVEENAAQLEHTAFRIADRILDNLCDHHPPAAIVAVALRWSHALATKLDGKEDASSAAILTTPRPPLTTRGSNELLTGPVPWILRVLCKAILRPNQYFLKGFYGGNAGYRMAVMVTDLIYALYSPPGSRSYSVTMGSIDNIRNTHFTTLDALAETLNQMEITGSTKVESDLESTKHLAYHLCAVSEDLREIFTEDELSSLVMFFQLNDVYTRKLRPQLGARWQDKSEGYQNIFVIDEEQTSESGARSSKRADRSRKGSRRSMTREKSRDKDRDSQSALSGSALDDSASSGDTRERRKISKTYSQSVDTERKKSSSRGLQLSWGNFFSRSNKGQKDMMSRSTPSHSETGADVDDHSARATTPRSSRKAYTTRTRPRTGDNSPQISPRRQSDIGTTTRQRSASSSGRERNEPRLSRSKDGRTDKLSASTTEILAVRPERKHTAGSGSSPHTKHKRSERERKKRSSQKEAADLTGPQ